MSDFSTPELEFYETAAQFGDMTVQHTEPDAREEFKDWLQAQSRSSARLGRCLRIESESHHLDFSLGSNIAKRLRELEVVGGTLEGMFYGYTCLPYELEGRVGETPVLATVLRCEVAEWGEEHRPALVVTPIIGASIEYIP